MSVLSIRLLGSPSIERDGQPVALTRAKGTALLVYLALSRVEQGRERVLDLLWPESLPQAARKNLRNTLWALGEALGHDALEQTGTTLRLAPTVAVDVHGLEDGLLLIESGDSARLEAIVAAYRGPLADGLVVREAPEFELWLTAERERLAAVYLRLIERIVGLQRATGSWAAVLQYAAQALHADPLREALHSALIEAYVRLGHRRAAAAQYAALVETLRRELDVAPLPETTARYAALLADEPAPPQRVSGQRRPAERQPRFVGRTAELALLDAELARTATDGARVVMITGDLGLGKSRLWREWSSMHVASAHTLSMYALETSGPAPFGPIVTLLRQLGWDDNGLGPDSPLPRIWLAELARLLPEIADVWPDLPPPLALGAAEERARLLQALTELVRWQLDERLILVVDDLHWADPSTLDWLVYLVAHLRERPLLVIGTYRQQDAGAQLLATVAGWQRQGLLRTLQVPHLTPVEARQLLEAGYGAADLARVEHWVTQSGGNPYFLLELRQAAVDAPPADLAALVQARLRSTVPAAATQVLQAAAIVGTGAAFATLRATSGRSEAETLDALDALVEAGVLFDVEGVYWFLHPLVAEIVRRDLTPTRRAFLHRRAADALLHAADGQPARIAARLVEHFAAAGDIERAAHFADLAAEQALAVGGFVEAALFARRAVEWAPSAERELRMGEALQWSGDGRAARSMIESALAGFERAAEPVGVARAALLLALVAMARSQPFEARRWLARVPFGLAQSAEPALGVRAHLVAAGVERQLQSFAAAVEQLEQAEALARQPGLELNAAMVLLERGNLLSDRGDHRAAAAAFAAAVQQAERHGGVVEAAMAQNNLAFQLLRVGDLHAAQAQIRAAQAQAERYALGGLEQYVYSTAGEIAFALGDLAAAEAAFERAYAGAQLWDNAVHMANVRVNQALAAQARADDGAARALLEDASALFGAASDPFVGGKLARAWAAIVQTRK